MYYADVIYWEDNCTNTWNPNRVYYHVKLKFRNFRKLHFFVKYYSSKTNCIIKLYRGNWWFATWRYGKDIWNDF